VTRRLFVALPIPEDLLQAIGRRRRPLEGSLPSAAWVRPASQHLTLKFLGDVEEDGERRLIEALDGVKAAPVPVHFTGGGFFPARRSPRVAWLGGDAKGAADLATRVDRAAHATLHTDREKRPWALHVTQARIRHRWSKVDQAAFLEWAETLDLPPFTATEMVLYASDLRPSGAVYTARQVWTLD
jgi:2'-5' RNA ligase